MQSYIRRWWKESVVYQIYPRSFKDSNNDGIGDIQGIISKLDYLCDLGIDVIWLSPVYKSPNADNGYDISDYYNIMDEFGTMEDMDQLINEIHHRGLKLIMDLVVNHTSDEHHWFQESKKSKDNPYRDYYIWRPPKNGDVPNNWASCFSGSCWTLDQTTGEYYFHYFAEKQPDLNWDNPKVREEIYTMMEFWLKKGVDGFRMDVINAISKPNDFHDAIIVDKDSFYQPAGDIVFNGPKFLEYSIEMKNKVLSKHEAFTVGETHCVTVEHGKLYTAQVSGVLSTLFHFEMMNVDVVPGSLFGKWEYCMPNLRQIKKIMSRWQTELDVVSGWNSVFIENHDTPRSVSRFGNDNTPELRETSAKMLATWMLLLKGTPFIYQGQEIGTPNAYFDDLKDYRDIETFNAFKEMSTRRAPAVVMDSIRKVSRDNARTPMQWSSEEFGGFSENTSWIKPNPSFKTVNVAQARADPTSVWHYYKRLLEFRKKHMSVVYGIYQLILADHPEIYAYTRTLDNELILVICNFFDKSPEFNIPTELASALQGLKLTKEFCNYDTTREEQFDLDQVTKIKLRPYEARVYSVLRQVGQS